MHSDLDTLPIATNLRYPYIHSSLCPVCRTDTILYKGIPVTFKYSPVEPSAILDTVYELIMQPNGEVTIDWAGELDVDGDKFEDAIMGYVHDGGMCGGMNPILGRKLKTGVPQPDSICLNAIKKAAMQAKKKFNFTPGPCYVRVFSRHSFYLR